jgi:tetratricopeptide (TPR) repeat protein
MLDNQVWSDAAIKDKAEAAFIPFKVDCEKGEGITLAEDNKIFNYPTILVMNPDGSERDRFVGFQPVEPMSGWLDDMAANRNTTSQMMARVPSSSSDLQLILEVGSRLTDQARPEAKAYLEQALKLDADNKMGTLPQTYLIMADLARKTALWDEASRWAGRVAQEFPGCKEADRALSMVAYYEEKRGNSEGALAAQRELIQRHPDDPGYLNAFAWFCAKRHLNLEEATDVALKAVRVSDNDPGIMDTLAEVYYSRGMYGDAIDTMDKCLKAVPGDKYFMEQMDKFKKAQTGS